MKKKSLVTIIKSNEFAIWVAILSVVVQSFHSYTAFLSVSSLQNYFGIAQAVLFSVVIDLSILFYTVRNRRDIAMYAAVVMVIINAYYYYQHLGTTFSFAFGVFLSLIIPVSVYFYAEEIREDPDPDKVARDQAEQSKRLELMDLEKDLLKNALSDPDRYKISFLKRDDEAPPDDIAEVEYEEPVKKPEFREIPRSDRPIRE